MIRAADVDGDGDADVLASTDCSTRCDGIIVWYENTDGRGNFGQQHVIRRAGRVSSIHVADVDGDSDVDVLSASSGGVIEWQENTDGSGTFGPPQVITANTARGLYVYAADIDGDVDVASLGDRRVTWHENTDGQGLFGPPQVVGIQVGGGRAIHAADFDGDGDMDILAGFPARAK